jgi:hypothetical protein
MATVRRLGGITGLTAAGLIVIGIVAVSMIPDQANSGELYRAITQIQANPRAELVAGWAFAIGLAALVPFAWLLVRTLDQPSRIAATIGATALTIGATANAVGAMTMIVLTRFSAADLSDPLVRRIQTTILTLGIALDAYYNLALGIALILIGNSMRQSAGWPRWLGVAGIAIGVLSLPVAMEWASNTAALFQYASGTLFLLWAITASVSMLRAR